MAITHLHDISLDRMVRAVEKIRERLRRAVAALESAGIPYAVAGGNAVAAWVARVDEAATRNTRDVDILVRREDLPQIRATFEAAGFVYRHAAGSDMFLDGPGSSPRDAVHLLFANEKVREDYVMPSPDITEEDHVGEFRILALEALVRMKLTSYRDRDRMHLRDLLDIGLVNEEWKSRFPPELAERLQVLLDNPDG